MSTPSINDIKTKAGLLLNRQLPEEYRFLDTNTENELGDLEAYLHGFGHLLDLIRGTTEQAYADAYAESVDISSDSEGNSREIQTWLLPYLADLVGAELLAPDPSKRIEELNNAVSWFKTKGTLHNVDSIADVISGTETVLVEGWRNILLTPRLDLPPFTGNKNSIGNGEPIDAPSIPLGTPDFRFENRAVIDVNGANPLNKISIKKRNSDGILSDEAEITYWKPSARYGVPCFYGAYDDSSVRTPDLRNPEYSSVGPHPRRNLIHVRPPYGFFEPNLKVVELTGSNPLGFDLTNKSRFQQFGPKEILKAILGEPEAEGELKVPDKIIVKGNLIIPSDLLISFHNVLFTGKITVKKNVNNQTLLRLSECAVASIKLDENGSKPTVEANNCLIGKIIASTGFAQLIFCTVLGEVHIKQLWASECIFSDKKFTVTCDSKKTCVRYSSLRDLSDLTDCSSDFSANNIQADANFIRLYFKDEDGCTLRSAKFGEPGCGVLNLTTSISIREGAEDNGEMGAYHYLYYNAQLRVVKLKLTNFLPLGQEIAIRYDPRLEKPAATIK